MGLSFDTLYQGKLCGTTWAEAQDNPSNGEYTISCFQKFFDLKEIGLKKARAKSTYLFDGDGRPVSITCQAEGQEEKTITINHNSLNYGKNDIPLEEPLDFATESNMAPLLVLWWKRFHDNHEGNFKTLSVGSGAVFDFSLKRDGSDFQDSFGQTYHLDKNGQITEITKEASDFKIVRSERKLPNWKFKVGANNRKYLAPSYLNIEDVLLKADGKEIEATIARPESIEPKAVAVFIGGTGIYGRHGLTPQIDIGYHQLLDGLARLGIASVRYEKFDRNVSNAAEADGSIDFGTLCLDAERWLDWLDEQEWATGLPRILIGHSMGGMISLAIENRRQDLQACVLLTTPGRSMEEIIEQQINWQKDHSTLSTEAKAENERMRKALLDALEVEEEWTEENVDPRLLPIKHKKRFLKSSIHLDPCEFMKTGKNPVLILQGTKDVQVFMEDAENLYNSAIEAGRDVELIKAEGLDHLLKKNSGEGLEALAAYKDRRRRVPVAIIRKLEKSISRMLNLQ